MDGHDSQDPKQSPADMTAFFPGDLINVDRFLTFVYRNFSVSRCKIFSSRCRINELEQSINDLRAEMGVESSPSPATPAKPTEEITKEEGSA
ncbi:hypothetical protein JHK86_026795 [Glycine max]|nr:hypothetical protein JHK86_026795 [Glycine max]